MNKNSFLRLFRFKGPISLLYYAALLVLLWFLIVPHTSFYFTKSFFTPFPQRLNKDDVTLVKGEEFTLRVLSINKRISFTSTDIKVADVNIFGKITAYRVGTTIIKAKYGDKVLKCRVRVIAINKKKLNLKAGRSAKLRIQGAWFGARWSSGDTSVVVVSRFGKVTAVSKGSAKVYCKIRGKTLSCTVNVK